MLSFYTLLLWPSFISCLIVGYTAYKRRAFNIDGKLSGAWYGGYAGWGDEGRAIIQNTVRVNSPSCRHPPSILTF